MDEVPAGLPRLPFRVSVSSSTNGKPHGPLAPPPARGAGCPRSDPRPPRRPRRPAPALPSAAPGAAPTASGVRRRAASASGRGGRGVPLVAVQVRPARWVTHFLFPPRAPLPWCRGCVRRVGCHALAAWLWAAYRGGLRRPAVTARDPRGGPPWSVRGVRDDARGLR